MRRLLHTALGLWFVITMTMAQGCVGPAQSAGVFGGSSASSQAAGNSSARSFSRSSGPIDTSGYVADTDASRALTDHLHHNRLPLVGAQVLREPKTGDRAVVLYGYVGSDYGKSDAQRQAEDFVNDAAVEVDNRVHVKPELLAAGRSSQAPSGSNSRDTAEANAVMPGAQSYLEQQNQAMQAQQYQQQNLSSSMTSMVPLIVLLGILSMASGSGGFSVGPSRGYSPYSNSPYSPYSGYGSPGMPPSTFGGPGFGYGSSGGGATPFGTLPGSPYYTTP
jgi:hypothetical protein